MTLSDTSFFSSRETFTGLPLSFFLFEKQNEDVSLLQGVVQPVVLENFIGKLIVQDFTLDAYLRPASSVNIAFGAVNAFKTLKSTPNATEINNFRKTIKAIISNIFQNLSEGSITKLNMFSFRRNAICCGLAV